MCSGTERMSPEAHTMIKQYSSQATSEAIESVTTHRERIITSPFLRQLYGEWYEVFIAEMDTLPDGMKIELGAGGGFLKQVAPSIISTDSIPFPTNDLTFSPLSMPFNSESVSGIFMIDTFCQMADTHAFLIEAQRVLKPGGKIIMVEPACSIWGRVANRWLCQKSFNRSGAWSNTLSSGYERVNCAMTWIVFERDLSRFEGEFPSLSIQSIDYHTPLRYFLGGGSRFGRALVPRSSYPFFSRADAWLSGLSPHWSMFMTVQIEKKSIEN